MPATLTKGPWVQRVTTTAAVVRVEVEPPGPIWLEIDHRRIESPAVESLHVVTVTGLSPAARYAYSVHAEASTKSASFTTAPPDTSVAPFRFLAYGDNRSDPIAHASVVRAMGASSTDLIVHTGDFVENGASPEQWQSWFDVEEPLLRERCFVSCVGNHELIDGPGIQYARFFGPTDASGVSTVTRPEHLDATFRWGNTRFFLLNGVASFGEGPDRTWLEGALAAADVEPGLTWRIAVVHHGLWSSGPHHGNARLHAAGVEELLEAHKIDLMLSGHDHVYERGWGGKIPFIVTGGGGAPLYRVRKVTPESKKAESVHHFVEVAVSPTALDLVAVRADGSTIERCSLPKNAAGWDCGAGRFDAGAATMTPDRYPEPTKPRAHCGCDAVGAHGPHREGALVGLFVLGALVLGKRLAR